MPRKSKADHLTDLFGGKWTFDPVGQKSWTSDNGRTCYIKVDCICWKKPWMAGKPCDCSTYYELEDGTNVVFDDPRIYKLNGMKPAK